MTVVTDAPIGQDVVGNVRLVAIDRLRTSYMRLRPGAVPPRIEQGSELPLRVAPCPDSTEHFELIDGFKRLGRWREQGAALVPVVVERPARAEEHKRLMLTVNAPARTATVLDEARVVCSLLDDDGMTPRQISRLLGRKPAWVERRRDIGKRLSVGAEELVALGAVGPTLAHALSTLAHEEQDALLESIGKHGLRDRESLRLVQAWAVADAPDRKQLLRCPRGTELRAGLEATEAKAGPSSLESAARREDESLCPLPKTPQNQGYSDQTESDGARGVRPRRLSGDVGHCTITAAFQEVRRCSSTC